MAMVAGAVFYKEHISNASPSRKINMRKDNQEKREIMLEKRESTKNTKKRYTEINYIN